MRRLIALIREECANYSGTGPRGIRNYCCYEPKEFACECLMLHDTPCKWFKERLLPLKPELESEWAALLTKINAGHLIQHDKVDDIKQCTCGVKFVPRSNRHTLCPECSTRQQRKNNRERSRKRREKNTSKDRVARHALEHF